MLIKSSNCNINLVLVIILVLDLIFLQENKYEL
nr:MAG TPA: hypothetical protein [Caudoviricetes sp.]